MTPGMLDAIKGLVICLFIGAAVWLIGQIIYQIEERFRK